MSEMQLRSPYCNHPGLWIEHITIFEDVEQKIVLRQIPLQRGVNIVWGDSGVESEDDAEPGTLSGHSVGKSTFCRLLRYLLGENTFGRKGLRAGIYGVFKKAGVAAIIHVGDTQWAVLRPLGEERASMAAVGVTIDELLGLKPRACPYPSFVTALNETFIPQLPGATATTIRQRYRWEHLLSWVSRDQEARYRYLWEWRSSHSDSNVAQLKKADALTLMRMVFDLYSVEEEELSWQIERVQAEYKATSERLAGEHKDLITRIRREFDVFHQILLELNQTEPNEGGIFDYDQQADRLRIRLMRSLLAFTKRRDAYSEEIGSLQSELRGYEKEVDRLTAGIAVVDKASPDEEIAKEMERADSLADQFCNDGGIFYAKCEHYQAHTRTLRQEYDEYCREIDDAESNADDRMKKLREWTVRRVVVGQRDYAGKSG